MRYTNSAESQFLRRRAAGPIRSAALRHLPLPVSGRGEAYRHPPRMTLRGFGANAPAIAVLSTAKGASTGAAAGATAAGIIGTSAAAGSVVPVIGTAIGAIAGLLASGVFDRQDQEISDFNSAIQIYQQYGPQGVLNIANKYLVLAGLFDLQPSQIKGNIPFYRKYGRANEQRFVTDMVNLIYNAGTSGQITGSDTPQTIFTRIVQPWMGTVVDNNADLINYTIMGMIAEYVAGLQRRWLARSGDWPFAGLPTFSLAASALPAPSSTPAPASNPTDGQSLLIGNTGSLTTADGTWSFGAGMNSAGAPVLLNGAPYAGVFAIGLTTWGGVIYQVNQGGAWYSKAPGQGWAPSPAPQNGNAVYFGALQNIPQSTSATAPSAPATSTAASVPSTLNPATAPAIGSSLSTAWDSNSQTMISLPAGATFGGLTPSGAWIISYPTGPNAGNYTLFQGQLIPYNNLAVQPAPLPPPTSSMPSSSTILIPSLPAPSSAVTTGPTVSPPAPVALPITYPSGGAYYTPPTSNYPVETGPVALPPVTVSSGTDNSTLLLIGSGLLLFMLLNKKGVA